MSPSLAIVTTGYDLSDSFDDGGYRFWNMFRSCRGGTCFWMWATLKSGPKGVYSWGG